MAASAKTAAIAARVSVLLMAAIIAPSCAVQHPYRQSFAPQFGTATGAFRITDGSPATPAITDTDCATDFGDVLPTDNRFDDRPIADWGDLDDGCDPFPQNERPSVF